MSFPQRFRFCHSLRFRIIFACVLFALAVNIFYGFLVLITVKVSEDELFNWHITQRTQQLLDAYNDDSLAVDVDGAIHGDRQVLIASEAQLLAGLRDWGQVIGTEPITLPENGQLENWYLIDNVFNTEQGYRLFELSDGQFTMHIVRAALQNSSDHYFYYLVDISDFSLDDTYFALGVSLAMLVSVALTLLLAVLVGWRVARFVISPLTRLSNELESTRADNTVPLRGDYYADEVGLLGARINKLFQRIGHFVSREKAFARDASHELRTPVTSSQMALELIQTLPQTQDTNSQRLLARIERANKDMVHLIESFLLLGKEQERGESSSQCSAFALAQAALDKHAYVLGDKSVDVINRIDTDLYLQQPPKLLAIVINNLVRNAFQYTETGSVELSGDTEAIWVKDTGPGFAAPSVFKAYENGHADGLGLGLNIVQRICLLRGWTLAIDSQPGQGSCIRVMF